jgi:chlorinating enzyme
MSEPLRRLTPEQIDFFYQHGYLRGIPVCDPERVVRNKAGLEELKQRLAPRTTLSEGTFVQERYYPYLFELANNSAILDCVEDLLGPDIILWGVHIACKEPGDGEYSWHQDRVGAPIRLVDNPKRPAHYPDTLSVWLAIDHAYRGNGAYKVIPGSLRAGLLEHANEPREVRTPDGRVEMKDNITLRFDENVWDPATAVYMELQPGEISIHHDLTIHMSEPNHSQQRRAGATISFSRTDVKVDLSVWPNHRSRLMRGTDEFGLNPMWEHFEDEPIDLLKKP